MVKRRVTELTNPEVFQEIKMVSPMVIHDFSFDGRAHDPTSGSTSKRGVKHSLDYLH